MLRVSPAHWHKVFPLTMICKVPWACHATHGHLVSPRSWKEELAAFHQVVDCTVDFYSLSLRRGVDTVFDHDIPSNCEANA